MVRLNFACSEKRKEWPTHRLLWGRGWFAGHFDHMGIWQGPSIGQRAADCGWPIVSVASLVRVNGCSLGCPYGPRQPRGQATCAARGRDLPQTPGPLAPAGYVTGPVVRRLVHVMQSATSTPSRGFGGGRCSASLANKQLTIWRPQTSICPGLGGKEPPRFFAAAAEVASHNG
jgi:hypothetical protein